MELGLHANIVEYKTQQIGDDLRSVFTQLAQNLNGDYGGIMEHLWIDLELIENRSRSDGKPRFPFRFQKRVSGSSRMGLPSIPDKYNVGHFSVRPNFSYLQQLSGNVAVEYCLKLIYSELLILKDKEKKLGGFDSELFRNSFSIECGKLGYDMQGLK